MNSPQTGVFDCLENRDCSTRRLAQKCALLDRNVKEKLRVSARRNEPSLTVLSHFGKVSTLPQDGVLFHFEVTLAH